MGGASAGTTPTAAAVAAAPVPDLLGDLLDLDVPATAPAAAPVATASDLPVVFGEDKGKGVVLRARMAHTAAEGYVYEVRPPPVPCFC